jgi:hypothetical protein
MSATQQGQGANTNINNAAYWGPAGYQTSGGSVFNGMAFLARQIIAGKAFAAIVKVISVSGGGPGAAPMVAVQPMVNQFDGLGNQTAHGTIYNIPAFRYQGGSCAVIVDPAVGDIGQAVICDRDISGIKATGKIGAPGSNRQNNYADGMYYGGFINGAPTIYFRISAAGVAIVAPGLPVTIASQNCNLDSSGNLTLTGDVIANQGGSQVSLMDHLHSDVSTGSGESGPPVPGT